MHDIRHIGWIVNWVRKKRQQGREEEVFVFCGTPTESRVRKFRTPDSDSGTKKLGLRLQAQNQTATPTLRLIVWHNDCVLTNDLREIFTFF